MERRHNNSYVVYPAATVYDVVATTLCRLVCTSNLIARLHCVVKTWQQATVCKRESQRNNFSWYHDSNCMVYATKHNTFLRTNATKTEEKRNHPIARKIQERHVGQPKKKNIPLTLTQTSTSPLRPQRPEQEDFVKDGKKQGATYSSIALLTRR